MLLESSGPGPKEPGTPDARGQPAPAFSGHAGSGPPKIPGGPGKPGKPGWQGEPPPPGPQGIIATLTKLILFTIMITFIVGSTAAGVVLAKYITVLGIVLNARAILQYVFANLNNRRMIRASGRAMIDGILYKYPNLSPATKEQLNKLVGKKLTIFEFMRKVEKLLGKEVDDPVFWRSVAYNSIKVLDMVVMITRSSAETLVQWAFENYPDLTGGQKRQLKKLVGKKLTIQDFRSSFEKVVERYEGDEFWATVPGNKKYNISRVIHVNVPIYHMIWKDLYDVLEALRVQLMTPAVIWLVPNGDELPGEPVRRRLEKYVEKQQQDAQNSFDQGLIDQSTYEMLLNKWQIIDLEEGDKRASMLTAWLATFGVAPENLVDFVKQLFDKPNQLTYAIGDATAQISLNVDSDTVAHFMASFITYLTFVQFDIAGLTSNVRISNISDEFDRSLPWRKAFEKWFMSWSNYFKYDFANNVERAAQSWFYNVVCMSGPWMAIRTALVPEFMARFVNYKYNGVRIKPGDDRKVTYELNMRREKIPGSEEWSWFRRIFGTTRRLRTVYHPWVVVFTDAPDNVPRYVSIQDRWTQSMYANFFTSLQELQILLLHPWTILDQLYAAGFTFLVMGVFGRLFYEVITAAMTSGLQAVGPIVAPYVLIFAIVNLSRGIYAVWDNKDPRGMLNSLYVILVVRYLIPVKMIRLFWKGIAPKVQVWAGR